MEYVAIPHLPILGHVGDLLSLTPNPTSRKLVVMGLGYVGLNLSCEFSLCAIDTVGFDISTSVVNQVNSNQVSDDIISKVTLASALKSGFRATTDESCLNDASEIVICVPTPLNDSRKPDTSYIEQAAWLISKHLQIGQLIILESTSFPGTTEDLLIPILERSGLKESIDFSVAFSSERVDPGNRNYNLRNTPKVVAARRPEVLSRVAEFYSSISESVVETNMVREAEFSKLLENSYRLVNIAFINELARLSEIMNINLDEAIRLASTKPFGFQTFKPGPGVGGHCIPIDPVFLNEFMNSQSLILSNAIKANSKNSDDVARNIQSILKENRLAIPKTRITLIGLSYKVNSTDIRESAGIRLGKVLVAADYDVSFYDPLIEIDLSPFTRIRDLDSLVSHNGNNLMSVILQKHDCIDISKVTSSSKMVFDATHTLSGPNIYRV